MIVPFNEICRLFTLPAKHFCEHIVTEVVNHKIWRDNNDNYIMLFAFVDELVVVNLRLIPKQPIFLIADGRAVIVSSSVYIVKKPEHVQGVDRGAAYHLTLNQHSRGQAGLYPPLYNCPFH